MYLADTAASALLAYLAVRGSGATQHVFLYRHKPVGKDFLRTTLEQLDGFCLDNEADREALVPLLANALIQATQSGELVLPPFPLEPDPPPSQEY